MKKTYVSAQMEIVLFDNEDVITTSGDTGGLVNGGIYDGTGNENSGKFEDLFPGLKN